MDLLHGLLYLLLVLFHVEDAFYLLSCPKLGGLSDLGVDDRGSYSPHDLCLVLKVLVYEIIIRVEHPKLDTAGMQKVVGTLLGGLSNALISHRC